MKKQLIMGLGLALVLIGCGSGTTNQESGTTLPTNYSNKVVNNRGLVVEGNVDTYSIKIYSDAQIEVSPKNIHKGVVVKVNGKSSETMPIEIGYMGKHIVAALYDSNGNEVAVSSEIEVTDVPVIIVDMSI